MADLAVNLNRVVDIDDVISNTLGVFGGYLVLKVSDHTPLTHLVRWALCPVSQEPTGRADSQLKEPPGPGEAVFLPVRFYSVLKSPPGFCGKMV